MKYKARYSITSYMTENLSSVSTELQSRLPSCRLPQPDRFCLRFRASAVHAGPNEPTFSQRILPKAMTGRNTKYCSKDLLVLPPCPQRKFSLTFALSFAVHKIDFFSSHRLLIQPCPHTVCHITMTMCCLLFKFSCKNPRLIFTAMLPCYDFYDGVIHRANQYQSPRPTTRI